MKLKKKSQLKAVWMKATMLIGTATEQTMY